MVVVIVVLGGKMVLFGPARVLAVDKLTEVESQVAAVVWFARWRIFEKSGGLFATVYHIV